MLRFIAQHRVLFLVLLLVLLGLHLLSTGLKHKTDLGFFGRVTLAVYSPIYQVLSWPFARLADGLSGYFWLVGVKADNVNLRKQNELLRAQLVEFKELRAENERLAAVLRMAPPGGPPTAHARVIGRSSQVDFHVVLLDAGSSAGVAKGMAVATPEGLVGAIVAVAPNASKAVLLTDPSSRVDVILQRSRKRGILFGRGRNVCTLEYLDSEADALEGDLLITSGADGVFPKGLAVGAVAAVNRGDQGAIHAIVVAPAARLTTFEEAAVLPRTENALQLTP
jgi:rod shape-determining protein MreC